MPPVEGSRELVEDLLAVGVEAIATAAALRSWSIAAAGSRHGWPSATITAVRARPVDRRYSAGALVMVEFPHDAATPVSRSDGWLDNATWAIIGRLSLSVAAPGHDIITPQPCRGIDGGRASAGFKAGTRSVSQLPRRRRGDPASSSSAARQRR